jgi:hypothetical protein
MDMLTHYYTNVYYGKFSMHPGEGAAITVTYFPAIESRRSLRSRSMFFVSYENTGFWFKKEEEEKTDNKTDCR